MTIRCGSVILLVAGVLAPLLVRAQPPAPKTATPAPAGTAPRGAATPPAGAAAAPRPAILDEVLATVNGEKITRGELIRFLNRYQLPPVGQEQIYRDALETIISLHLIGQFVARQQIPDEKINEAVAQVERNLRSSGRGDLQSALQESGQTMDELRRDLAWGEFVKLKATDAELKRFASNHNDLVSGAQIKASHVFLKIPPGATPAEKEKVRQKLVSIRQEIADKKLTFAAAANKYSEDPANAEGSGGDIGYFGLNTGIVAEFADAAFALKPGEISQPVETLHGLHLIQVTDRKAGNPVDFEQPQQKQIILKLYTADLQKQILAAERKSAEEKHAIVIKPMPSDLFVTAPARAAAPPTGAGATPPAAGTGTAPPVTKP
jgi:parvulin-like peptidyl-prolyl isomerase